MLGLKHVRRVTFVFHESLGVALTYSIATDDNTAHILEGIDLIPSAPSQYTLEKLRI